MLLLGSCWIPWAALLASCLGGRLRLPGLAGLAGRWGVPIVAKEGMAPWPSLLGEG